MAQQRIPKIIHICCFGGGAYPVEVKACMDSWKRILPDYVGSWRKQPLLRRVTRRLEHGVRVVRYYLFKR